MVSPYSSHSLTKDEIARFNRQLMLKGIGPSGQERLRDTRVLILGAGELGCPVALYLVAAGVGRLAIVDHDTVSVDNLHCQTAHDENRVDQSKAESLRESLLRMNSRANVLALNMVLSSKNALELCRDYDIVADCSDNVTTRFLLDSKNPKNEGKNNQKFVLITNCSMDTQGEWLAKKTEEVLGWDNDNQQQQSIIFEFSPEIGQIDVEDQQQQLADDQNQ